MELKISDDIRKELSFYIAEGKYTDLEDIQLLEKLESKKQRYTLSNIRKIINIINYYDFLDYGKYGSNFANKALYFLISNGFFNFTDFGDYKRYGKKLNVFKHIPYTDIKYLKEHCYTHKQAIKKYKEQFLHRPTKSIKTYSRIKNIVSPKKECEWAYDILQGLCEEFNVEIGTLHCLYNKKGRSSAHYSPSRNKIYASFVNLHEKNLHAILHEFSHLLQYKKFRHTIGYRNYHTESFYKEIALDLFKRFGVLEIATKYEYKIGSDLALREWLGVGHSGPLKSQKVALKNS